MKQISNTIHNSFEKASYVTQKINKKIENNIGEHLQEESIGHYIRNIISSFVLEVQSLIIGGNEKEAKYVLGNTNKNLRIIKNSLESNEKRNKIREAYKTDETCNHVKNILGL